MRGLEREAKVTILELALETSSSRSCSNFAHAIPSVIPLGKVCGHSSLLHMDLSISASFLLLLGASTISQPPHKSTKPPES